MEAQDRHSAWVSSCFAICVAADLGPWHMVVAALSMRLRHVVLYNGCGMDDEILMHFDELLLYFACISSNESYKLILNDYGHAKFRCKRSEILFVYCQVLRSLFRYRVRSTEQSVEMLLSQIRCRSPSCLSTTSPVLPPFYTGYVDYVCRHLALALCPRWWR